MASLNIPNPNVDLTVRLFDNFTNFALEVPTDEYDAVNSYFRSIFGNQQVADNFTLQIFRVSANSRRPVLDILSDMQGQDAMTITADIAYYLNGLQSPATLLGVNAIPQPNIWAARNVIV